MGKTRHYASRIQQRGIREETVALAERYGYPQGEKMILGKKQIRCALQAIDKERKQLVQALDQGGIVSIERDGKLVTAYLMNTRNFNRSHS